VSSTAVGVARVADARWIVRLPADVVRVAVALLGAALVAWNTTMNSQEACGASVVQPSSRANRESENPPREMPVSGPLPVLVTWTPRGGEAWPAETSPK